jgi:anti-sigma factor RsiW
MICPDREAQLNEYVDGTLEAAERAAVEQHLAACAGCRAAVAELRTLLAQAGSLPQSIEPSRDLWGGIAARIGQRATWNLRRAFWAGALAAAATLVIAFGLYRLLPSATDLSRPAGRGAGWAAVQADYERAATELERTLAAERGRLRPETIALVERNLRIIDAAIAESRAALARDPGNVELRQLYAAAYRQKVELLRWVARVATAS